MEEGRTRFDGGGNGTRLSGYTHTSPRARRNLQPKGPVQDGSGVRIKAFILALLLLAGKCPTPPLLTCKVGPRMVLPLPDVCANSWF